MSKPFRLRRVLEHRRGLEREQQGVMALARRAAAEGEQTLGELLEHGWAERVRARANSEGTLDVGGAERSHRYRAQLGEAISTQEERVGELGSALSGAEETLLVRRRDRRVLEKLEERHRDRIAEEEERQDAALTDEVVMGREARRLAG